MKFKVFSETKHSDLEEAINDWWKKSNVVIEYVSFSHSSVFDSDDVCFDEYCALVVYNEKEKKSGKK